MNEVPVAGVNVSKEFSDMCILAPDNTVFERVKVYHDKTSMSRAVKVLDRASRAFSEKPVVVMESTSHYHRLLRRHAQTHQHYLCRSQRPETLCVPFPTGASCAYALQYCPKSCLKKTSLLFFPLACSGARGLLVMLIF